MVMGLHTFVGGHGCVKKEMAKRWANFCDNEISDAKTGVKNVKNMKNVKKMKKLGKTQRFE